MTDENKRDDGSLDALLQEAAVERSLPPGLMARVLADAQALQPALTPRQRPFAALIEVLGGWPGVGGLAAASCAGFWIGISPPAGVPDAGDLIFGAAAPAALEEIDLAGFGWAIEEG
jgi:hypothetical protein